MEDPPPKYPELGYLTIRFSILDDRERFFRMVKEKVEGIREAEGGKTNNAFGEHHSLPQRRGGRRG